MKLHFLVEACTLALVHLTHVAAECLPRLKFLVTMLASKFALFCMSLASMTTVLVVCRVGDQL